MKSSTLLLFLFFCVGTTFSQSFKYGAFYTEGMFVKSTGEIVINDTNVVWTMNGQTNTYNVLSKVNRVTYFGDGIKTHNLTIQEETGKKKGWNYTHQVVLEFNGRPMMLYCIEK